MFESITRSPVYADLCECSPSLFVEMTLVLPTPPRIFPRTLEGGVLRASRSAACSEDGFGHELEAAEGSNIKGSTQCSLVMLSGS